MSIESRLEPNESDEFVLFAFPVLLRALVGILLADFFADERFLNVISLSSSSLSATVEVALEAALAFPSPCDFRFDADLVDRRRGDFFIMTVDASEISERPPIVDSE
jgi:hypothetical protein